MNHLTKDERSAAQNVPPEVAANIQAVIQDMAETAEKTPITGDQDAILRGLVLLVADIPGNSKEDTQKLIEGAVGVSNWDDMNQLHYPKAKKFLLGLVRYYESFEQD